MGSVCPTLLIDNDNFGHTIRRIPPILPLRPPPDCPPITFSWPPHPTLSVQPDLSPQHPPLDIADLPAFAVFLSLHPSPPPHTSLPALLLHSLAPTTVHSYTNALVSFRQWTLALPSPDPTSTLHRLIELYLLYLSSPPRSSSARTFLAAVAFAHTISDTPSPVNPIHWRCVSALTRISPTPHRSWFLADFLTPACLAQVAPHMQPRTYGTCLFALVFLLRISEARSVTPADLSRQVLCFRPAKRSSTTPYRRPLSPFLEPWSAYLRTNSEADSPFDLLGAQQFLTLLHPLAGHLTWHSFRRGGAAILTHLGLHTSQLLSWGKSKSPAVKLYCFLFKFVS